MIKGITAGIKGILLLLVIVSCSNNVGQKLTIRETPEGVEVLEDSMLILFFNKQPAAIDGKYERAGFVHPLYDMEGKVLTENGPADHPHHRGIFWAWHQVLLKGKQVGDGWVSDHIRFIPQQLKTRQSGDDILLDWSMTWQADSVEGKPAALIAEQTIIRVQPATDSLRMIDFDIYLRPLQDSVAIGGSNDIKGYGGFSMRWKLPANLRFETRDSAVQPQEPAVMGGPWMQFRGQFNGEKETAVSLLCAAPYPGPAQSWILRGPDAVSMQNALYPGSAPVLLPKAGLHLRYRLVVQRHPLQASALEALWKQFQQEKPVSNPIHTSL